MGALPSFTDTYCILWWMHTGENMLSQRHKVSDWRQKFPIESLNWLKTYPDYIFLFLTKINFFSSNYFLLRFYAPSLQVLLHCYLHFYPVLRIRTTFVRFRLRIRHKGPDPDLFMVVSGSGKVWPDPAKRFGSDRIRLRNTASILKIIKYIFICWGNVNLNFSPLVLLKKQKNN